VRVSFFGVRGSCPCSSDQHRRYGGNTSCTTVEVAGEPPIIMDLGTGLRPLGLSLLGGTDRAAEAAAEAQAPALLAGAKTAAQWTALLSHLHWDHLIGLPFFPPLLIPGAHLDVYGPAQDGRTIREVVDSVVKPPFFPVQVDELHGSIQFHDVVSGVLTVGSATVLVRQIPHVGTTLGFRIEAGGAVLAYLPDHQAPPGMKIVAAPVLELCAGADLLIHDAQYTEAEFETKSDWGHSTPAYAVHVAAEAGVGTLALFHHDPVRTDDQMDSLVADAGALPDASRIRNVIGATEGMVLDVAHGAVEVAARLP